MLCPLVWIVESGHCAPDVVSLASISVFLYLSILICNIGAIIENELQGCDED